MAEPNNDPSQDAYDGGVIEAVGSPAAATVTRAVGAAASAGTAYDGGKIGG